MSNTGWLICSMDAVFVLKLFCGIRDRLSWIMILDCASKMFIHIIEQIWIVINKQANKANTM